MQKPSIFYFAFKLLIWSKTGLTLVHGNTWLFAGFHDATCNKSRANLDLSCPCPVLVIDFMELFIFRKNYNVWNWICWNCKTGTLHQLHIAHCTRCPSLLADRTKYMMSILILSILFPYPISIPSHSPNYLILINCMH